MRMKPFALLAGASLFVLAACNTTDPNKGGLFGGIGGLASGNYEEGVQEREKQLEDAQDEQVSLQREADRADQQNAALESEIAATQADLDTLDRDLATLQNAIDRAEADKAADQAELDALQAELNDIDAEVDAQSLNFDETEKKAKLAELQRRKERLEDALVTLLE